MITSISGILILVGSVVMAASRELFDSQEQVLYVAVVDTGIGIAEEDIERVFEPFEQVCNKTGGKFHGTGLGLPITRDLVELHRGVIWADSRGKDQGSKFSMLMPL